MVYRVEGTPSGYFYSERSGSDGHGNENYYWLFKTVVKQGIPVETYNVAWGYNDEILAENRALKNMVQNQIAAHIHESIVSGQYMADLLEMKKSIQGLTEYAYKLLKLAVAVKNVPKRLCKGILRSAIYTNPKPKNIRGRGRREWRRRKDADEKLSQIPSEWLAFNFGLMPFVGSVADLAKAMSYPEFGVSYRKIVRNIPFTVQRIGGKTPRIPTQCVGQCNWGFKLSPENPNAFLAERLGFTKFFGTAWEIAPWSWAVDYFINVGDLMKNCDPLYKTVNIIHAYQTWKYSITDTVRWPTFDELNIREGVTVTRTPSLSRYFVPELNFDLSIRRFSYLVSAVALTLKGMK